MKKGDRFDALMFVRYTFEHTSERKSKGIFLCDCGEEIEFTLASVRRKWVYPKSCGCLRAGRIKLVPMTAKDVERTPVNKLLMMRWI